MAHAATSPGFSVGKLLSRSWSIFIGNIGSFLILSALVYAPLLIFVVFTLGGGSSDEIVLGATGVISGILTFLLSFVVMAVIIQAAFQSLRAQPVSIGTSFAQAWSRILVVIVLAILQALAIGLGLLVLIIPGIIIAIMLYVSMACCLVERLGPIKAMGRSMELTKGYRWHLFGALIVFAIIMMIVSLVVAGLQFVIGQGLIGALLDWILSVAYSAFMSVTVAVAYHDLRVDKEGIDIEKIAAMFE